MTEVTEDDRRRAQDAALSVRPLLASKFLGMDCPLVEAIALALAETREWAEARLRLEFDTTEREYFAAAGKAEERIAELEAENKQLQKRLAIFQRNAGLTTTEATDPEGQRESIDASWDRATRHAADRQGKS